SSSGAVSWPFAPSQVPSSHAKGPSSGCFTIIVCPLAPRALSRKTVRDRGRGSRRGEFLILDELCPNFEVRATAMSQPPRERVARPRLRVTRCGYCAFSPHVFCAQGVDESIYQNSKQKNFLSDHPARKLARLMLIRKTFLKYRVTP